MRSTREIARIYFPEVGEEYAVRKLKQWIDRCRELKALLRRQGYRDGCHYLTEPQVRSIFRFLGEG